MFEIEFSLPNGNKGELASGETPRGAASFARRIPWAVFLPFHSPSGELRVPGAETGGQRCGENGVEPTQPGPAPGYAGILCEDRAGTRARFQPRVSTKLKNASRRPSQRMWGGRGGRAEGRDRSGHTSSSGRGGVWSGRGRLRGTTGCGLAPIPSAASRHIPGSSSSSVGFWKPGPLLWFRIC